MWYFEHAGHQADKVAEDGRLPKAIKSNRIKFLKTFTEAFALMATSHKRKEKTKEQRARECETAEEQFDECY